ncbi:MAG: TolC family protein [Armatimonadetes bacterium]|nr:TolC family protein [Armatimonadota bacterium]
MHWIPLVMAGCLASGLGAQEAAPARPLALSLSSAVALALEQNPSLAAMREELPAALARLQMARAEGRLTASANTYLSTGTMPSTMPSSAGVMPRMYMGVPDTSRVDQNLMFMYPLSTGGRVGSRARAAAADRQATERDLESMVLDVAYAARAAYWLALYRADLVGVQEGNVSAQSERLRVDQAKYDAGKIPLFYVLRDKAELADAEQELTHARRDVETALLDLRSALGLRMAEPVELTDQLLYDPAAAEQDAEQLAAAALTSRPEALALRARTEAARREVAVRRASYRPQVDAMLMLDAEKASGMGVEGGYTIGIVGSLPLLDGGDRKAGVAEAEAMVRKLEQEQRALGLRIERELHGALLDLAAANQNVRTALEAEAAAEEDHRVAKVGYDAGKLINLEIIAALASLVKAGTNVAEAKYAYNLAGDAVQRAVGALPAVR